MIRAWAVVVTWLALMTGCETFPGVGVERGRNPPMFGFSAGDRAVQVIQIEFRNSDNTVIWRVVSDGAPSTTKLEFIFGVVPDGYVQTIPAQGAPDPLTSFDRSSVFVFTRSFFVITALRRTPDGFIDYDGGVEVGHSPYTRR